MGDIGQIVFSGQLIAALPLALLAGLVSFASPCILPLVPGYLAYVGGIASVPNGAKRRRRDVGRLLLGVFLFILGFSLVFVAYGAAFGAMGAWLVQSQGLITRILGAVVIVMGLVFVGQFGFMQRTAKLAISPATGVWGAPLLGIVFGIGWTPCMGPTLSAILSLSLNSASPWRGAILSLAYCLGLGIPFLLVALGLTWVTGSVAFLRRHIRAINITGGIMLVIIGVIMVSGLWTQWIYQLQAVISGFVPTI
ncbi:cytochrome c biogenesis protein CcdA [Alpinimonas psychrophila]|uniref:Cytochrome c-type biogenesis protein n=1 Tax=Alpinimonas psychrophila TaxID=748908 RepID=A0A7W3PPP7_9MICO|nr:cytochrome c-type biogenesis protein [Alpinimonas psychrophila]